MKTVELRFDENPYFVREAYNSIRVNLLFSGENIKTIVFTSCLPNEGKTTLTLELAKNLAETGKKVLFLDADLRKSVTVSRYTDRPGMTGLSQVLSGQAQAEEVILQTQIPGLHVLFSGPFPPNPTELLGGGAFEKLLNTVAPEYDFVLIDTSPLGLVVDAAVIAEHCNGAVMVINRGKAKTRMAKSVAEQLRRSGCRILGAIFNHPFRTHRYTGDRYSSYRAYGKKQ
ncbi:MAG: CpsD/CapB family tyrosine-protein kinase [Ruminococcaceae bacterium]|nr:CpsD/CapB family tyrosine-protein kinase [Oscillospiraceae bacterium]